MKVDRSLNRMSVKTNLSIKHVCSDNSLRVASTNRYNKMVACITIVKMGGTFCGEMRVFLQLRRKAKKRISSFRNM